MSYNTYHKKVVLKVSDTQILFLARYSDSSLTTKEWSHRKKRFYEHHPHYYCVLTLDNDAVGFLTNKGHVREYIKSFIEHELECQNDFIKKYESWKPLHNEKSILEEDTYGGSRFPGGRKVKNMKSFLSVSRCVDIDDWVRENGDFILRLTIYEENSCKKLHEVSFNIWGKDDILRAEEEFINLTSKYPNCEKSIHISAIF